MSKVSKEFWVSDDFINDDQDIDLFNISRFRSANGKYNNKVIVTYEIDREVTIKESDLRKMFDDLEFSGRDYALIKQRIFGGGENE